MSAGISSRSPGVNVWGWCWAATPRPLFIEDGGLEYAAGRIVLDGFTNARAELHIRA